MLRNRSEDLRGRWTLTTYNKSELFWIKSWGWDFLANPRRSWRKRGRNSALPIFCYSPIYEQIALQNYFDAHCIRPQITHFWHYGWILDEDCCLSFAMYRIRKFRSSDFDWTYVSLVYLLSRKYGLCLFGGVVCDGLGRGLRNGFSVHPFEGFECSEGEGHSHASVDVGRYCEKDLPCDCFSCSVVFLIRFDEERCHLKWKL